jgi:hypothetical protein
MGILLCLWAPAPRKDLGEDPLPPLPLDMSSGDFIIQDVGTANHLIHALKSYQFEAAILPSPTGHSLDHLHKIAADQLWDGKV